MCFATLEPNHLSLLIFGKEIVAECDKRDRYGRFVCKVMRGDADVCEAMLWAGLAWHYKEYQNEQSDADRKRYASVETVAKESGLGLWADAAAVAPWSYRHSSTVEAWKRTETPVVPDVATTPQGSILGNRNSSIYHWPGCPNYNDIAVRNRVAFSSREEAEKAGYRAAKNCPSQAATQAIDSTSAPASTGGTVNVRGYYRKDGTYVRPHTRRAPRKKN
ncbi:MAG: thermonuclease family protein [Rubrivivax sp.]|nr:thermonuclease family protein [Pyrinomonadaceae bacterium]